VSRPAGSSTLPRVASGTIWTPLGPAPLASDATGLGVQGYGPVAAQVPPTCNVSPATLTPPTAGAAFTVTADSDVQDHFNFTIDGPGTDAAHIHQSTPVELIVGFNSTTEEDRFVACTPATRGGSGLWGRQQWRERR